MNNLLISYTVIKFVLKIIYWGAVTELSVRFDDSQRAHHAHQLDHPDGAGPLIRVARHDPGAVPWCRFAQGIWKWRAGGQWWGGCKGAIRL